MHNDMTKTLYPYQKKAVRTTCALLRDGETPLLYAPTGAGKTVVAGEIMGRISGMRVFVVHTQTLREQAQRELLEHGAIVVTIQSLLLAPDMFRDAAVVCFDECHHLKGQAWRKALDVFPNAAIFGLTATPHPTALDEIFTCRVDIARVEHLIELGIITPVLVSRPGDEGMNLLSGPDDRIDGAAAYASVTPGRQAIHFEPTVALCERARLQYQERGIAAAVVQGKTAAATRETALQAFKQGHIQVLISPVLLSEGFDAPCAEVLVAGRAFESDTLLFQAVGRVRRRFPGKSSGRILDCTGCCANRSPDYFNATDESLFSSLPSSEDESRPPVGERADSSAPKRQHPIRWVEVPAEYWITEGIGTIGQQLARAEHADAVALVERTISERKREKKRESKRLQYQRSAEHINADRRADRAANPKKYADRIRRRRLANLEKVRGEERARYAANLEKKRALARASTKGREQDPKRQAWRAEWLAANAEKRREKSRIYHAANAEKRREYNRAYRAANAQKLAEKARARAAAKKAAAK